MLKRYAVLFVLCLSSGLLFSGHGWAARAVDVQVPVNTPQSIVVEYQFEDFTRTPVDIEGVQYMDIQLPSEGVTMEVGAPAVPLVARSIIIPNDKEMAVRVIDGEYYEIRDIGVIPSKGNILRTVDPADVPWTFGESYHTDGFYPGQLAVGGEPYIMRDHRGLVVTVYPFQYNSVTRILRVYTSMTVEVEALGPGRVNVLEQERQDRVLSRAFHDLYSAHFINYNQNGRYDPLVEEGDMLIIVHDAWNANVQPLADHKESFGINTTVVDVSEIGNNATAIRNYIQDVYDTSDLAFVLLVGDAAQVATPQASGGASDPTYSKVAGSDDYPDIMVGRFSAESEADVDTQVERTVEYEENQSILEDWFWRGMGVASNQGPGDDGEYDNEHIDNIRDDLLAYGYTLVDQIYDPNASAAQVTEGLNEGRGWINYCGHGGPTGWSTTGFSNSHVDALTNDNMLPTNFTVACNCGEFDSYTCFAEAWLRATNGSEPTGAIAAYMSSVSQSWNPPMEAQDECNLLYVAGTYNCYGTLCYAGSCSMMDEYGGDGVAMFDTWIYFGDPSLNLRYVAPDEIRGLVRNATTGAVMESVLVEVASLEKFYYTDEYGFYSLRADFPESVQITASFIGYEADPEWITVIQEGVTYHNIYMTAVNPGMLAGTVTDLETGEGIGGTVSVYSGLTKLTYGTIDDVTGYFELEVPEGTWTVTIDPENPYMSVSEPNVVIVMGETTMQDFQLAPLTEFVDVSGSSGIAYGGYGEGVSFVDFDGDGDEDIFVVNLFGDNRMLRNDGGTFTDVAALVGLTGNTKGFASVWGDYDRDNDLDCFISQRSGYSALYRNDSGIFTDVALEVGVAGEDWDYGQGAAWFDMNNDGLLDLYVVNKLGPNRLFINLGGSFEEVGSLYGADDPGAGAGVSIADYDNDGDSDIYIVNSAEEGNVLLRNDNPGFTDVSIIAGVGHTGKGRGSCWGDIDGDGDMDLFVTNDGADVLYRNDGGVFTDVTGVSGVGDTGVGTGCAFADYDNDGDQDLVVVTGTALLLYLNDGAGTFVEVSDLIGLSGGLGAGLAFGDVDDDGDQDLYVARTNYFDDLLFENLGNANTWLNVSLRGARSDKNGVGARIEAWVGNRHYVRDVVTGSGFFSQNSIETEIGLIRESVVDSLIVQWPSGKRSKLVNIGANQRINVGEGMSHRVPVLWE
jgi:hypothetical protein